MNRIDDFFKFEVTNKLFDPIDKKGLRPWEAIRFHVCCRIINKTWSTQPPQLKQEAKQFTIKHLWQTIVGITSFLHYFILHRNRPLMFLLCSRDKREGIHFDKICGDLFDMSDKKKVFAIDTIWCHSNYKYRGDTCTTIFLSFFSILVNRKYDFSRIYQAIKKVFPDIQLDVKELDDWYHTFLVQYYAYKFLFQYCKTKKLFMVQNGIQKGVFAAAHDMNVEVFELQHGQISHNHPAYSYPDSPEIPASKVYHPSKLLIFGDFWVKDRYYPGVENIIIGNDSYVGKTRLTDTNGNKRILVISDKFEGPMLINFVKGIHGFDPTLSFFFKLHPNQYQDFSFYQKAFDSYPCVNVISDSQSINELLNQSEALLVVQSTTELEALRDGRKVFVIKGGAYKVMDFVLNEHGVFLIDSPQSFVEKYNSVLSVKLSPRTDLFVSFNKAKAAELLS